jgi:hypothetical protein
VVSESESDEESLRDVVTVVTGAGVSLGCTGVRGTGVRDGFARDMLSNCFARDRVING